MNELVHDFQGKLQFSKDQSVFDYCETIKQRIFGAVSCVESNLIDDKNGVDYWVELRGGAFIGIDHKVREKGASKWWSYNEPELALEVWSILPESGNKGKVGWTLDESKQTDYIFYSFDPEDSDQCFLLPFHLLRMAFRRKYTTWKKNFVEKTQQSNGWKSSAVFVPASVVLDAVSNEMQVTHPISLKLSA